MATNTFVELELPQAAQLAAYSGIEYDLRSAREFAQRLLDEMRSGEFGLSDPLTTAILVRYSRPFVTGVRRRLGDEALNVLTAEQRARHDYFRAIRDKHTAHSVNAFEDNQPVARYWIERVADEGIEQISCIQQRIVGLSGQDLIDLIDLIDALLAYVAQRLTEERARVLAIVRQMPLNEVLKGGPRADMRRPDPAKPRRQP